MMNEAPHQCLFRRVHSLLNRRYADVHQSDDSCAIMKDANYAETNSKVAAAAGMGVLAIDYRSLARVPVPALYPEPIEDVVAALVWLKVRTV